MQKREAIHFNYHLPFWPKAMALALASLSWLLIVVSPLTFISQLSFSLLLLAIAFYSLRTLSRHCPEQVWLIEQQWYMRFANQEQRQLAQCIAYSQPTNGALILRFRSDKPRSQRFALYLSAKTIGAANYRAICRHLLHDSEIGRH